uniref:M-phase phosphoprotein 6 n=1 Tax=Lotharella oceanica TaxID=641309 RepID=A0A7S2TWX5_9EUKA|mmetsp:Transcript_31957/g.59491  ORF Transcript_31957/g.59491 Transcript_31957/m.59491 type:complete len:187 (+) Transcript_31957:17-577(+)
MAAEHEQKGANQKNSKLSGRLKAMKFMRRKAEAEERIKLEKERNRKRKAAQWTTDAADSGSSSLVIVDDDDPYATRFILGRRSFGGFNPNVEKINAEAMGKVRGKKMMKGAVSDAEMAQRYTKFVGMRGKKAEKYDKKRGSKGRASRASRDDPKPEKTSTPKRQKRKSSEVGRRKPKPFIRPKDTL